MNCRVILKRAFLIACMIAGAVACECSNAQPKWCARNEPFCELDAADLPYYYHVKEEDVKLYSIKEYMNYSPVSVVDYFRTAKRCYSKYFEEKFGEKPDIVDNGPIYIMVLQDWHLNGNDPVIDSQFSRRREEICGLSRCTKCDPVWRIWDRRSTIYTVEDCLGIRNISHETFHQMICRTTNWFEMKKKFSDEAGDNFEEKLARDFEAYPCLYKGD